VPIINSLEVRISPKSQKTASSLLLKRISISKAKTMLSIIKRFIRDNLYKLDDKATKTLLYTYLKGADMYSNDELTLLAR